ncbi:MAG TPA: PD-(D/E)XK nuclease family protein [Candidatus Saccharimonadales bacterium]|nr:PD-(D/E)XK nuclease family protein [Candidatus Saccharimonadales bacterium]
MTKRAKNLYDPSSTEPFKLSRTKIENFVQCPRCFYIDRRLGVGRPSIPGFTLNSAVDTLLKKEFDAHRIGKRAHPIMDAYGIDAIPYTHEKLDKWRENFHGVQYLHEPTNFLIFGAVDDIWENPAGELIVVDYKSTSKAGEVNLDDHWKDAYKRQMEVYQWLLRRNGFEVQPIGYFVYANGQTDRQAFDAKLEFNLTLLPYEGDDRWVGQALIDIHKCLGSDAIPDYTESCEHCQYRLAANEAESTAKATS